MLVTDRKVNQSSNNTNFQQLPKEINSTTELTAPIFCNYCKKEDSNGKLCGRCKQVRYCSSHCLDKDREYHILDCISAVMAKVKKHKKMVSVGVDNLENLSSESKAYKVNEIIFDEVMPVVYDILESQVNEKENSIKHVSKYEILGYMERVLILARKQIIDAGEIFDEEAYNTSFSLLVDFFMDKLASEIELSSGTDSMIICTDRDSFLKYINLLGETIRVHIFEEISNEKYNNLKISWESKSGPLQTLLSKKWNK